MITSKIPGTVNGLGFGHQWQRSKRRPLHKSRTRMIYVKFIPCRTVTLSIWYLCHSHSTIYHLLQPHLYLFCVWRSWKWKICHFVNPHALKERCVPARNKFNLWKFSTNSHNWYLRTSGLSLVSSHYEPLTELEQLQHKDLSKLINIFYNGKWSKI